ncbi:MAG: hypothetical protein Q8K58_00245 [Acidimicrobiales bacterium]|nr:hypothetical protein [Acidimicrobiales bacterium]
MDAEMRQADNALMTTHFLRLFAAAVGTIAVAVPAACGDNDKELAVGPASSTSSSVVDAPSTCAEQALVVLNDDEVVAAVTAANAEGTAVPAEIDERLDLTDECNAELEAMSDADFAAFLAKVNPEVSTYVGTAVEEEFVEVGSKIG